MSWIRSAQRRVSEWLRKAKRVRGHWVPTNIQVLGHRGVGKTTLLKQLERRGNAYSGGETLGLIERRLIEDASKTRLDTVDISGREEEWNAWADLVASRLPAGIVFVIDHERAIEQHEQALRFLIGVLEDKEDVSRRCKAFMLFANKRDLWLEEIGDSSFANTWTDRFMPLLSKIEQLGIRTSVGSGCAKSYELSPDEFDALVSQFVDSIL